VRLLGGGSVMAAFQGFAMRRSCSRSSAFRPGSNRSPSS
jgi:hypothetical protein